jgi:hypothetical protein
MEKIPIVKCFLPNVIGQKMRPDSRILDNDIANENETRFIKKTDVPFLSDEDVRVMMEKNLEKIKAENWKVATRVKVPEEFRQSIFNTSFHTFREKTTDDTEEKDGKMPKEFDCKFIPTDGIPKSKYRVYDVNHVHDCSIRHGCQHCLTEKMVTSRRGYEENLSTFIKKDQGYFKIGDHVDGLNFLGNNGFAYTFCKSCAQEYKRPLALKNEIETSAPCLLGVIVDIILDFSTPCFTLIKNDEKLIPTSTFIDWVNFLQLKGKDEKEKQWFINCNLDSSMYGCVMLLERDNLFITSKGVDSIKEFEKLFEKKLTKK